MKPVIIIAIAFVLLVPVGIVYADYERENWFWQKGVTVDAEQGENSVKTIFSIPDGKTNSNSKTINWIFVRTETGVFIQAGVVYDSTTTKAELTPASFFYSDGITHYLALNPYRPNIENEVSIYYDNGWKVSFLDTEVNYFQEFDVDWASGTTINYGGIILESVANEPTIISSCEEIGTIDNIKDQKLLFGTNNADWRESHSGISGSAYNFYEEYVSEDILLHRIPPPDFTYIKTTQSGYEIGFNCPKNQLEPTPEIILEIIPEPEPTPEIIPEIIPELIPEPTPEIIPELIPEPTPEIIPEPTPEIIPEPTPDPIEEPETESPHETELVCGNGTIEKNGACVVDTSKQLESEPSKGGGCLIATATYGSELAPQVQQLRELRDNQLLNTKSGTSFMESFNDFYYSFSPYVADYERENPVFKEIVKVAITPMIASLSILNYVDMDSEESVLGYGISLILLNVGMYFVVPIIAIYHIKKITNF